MIIFVVNYRGKDMSKVDELKIKYPKVTKITFNKFVAADYTPTKKYLEFMLKTWSNRSQSSAHVTPSVIIGLVKQFDSLLPYINNKDIYHKDYTNLDSLKKVIENSETLKEEKTFVREDHANVLFENDRYILIQPTTHRGSLKYGAGTKWCTTSNQRPEVFDRYFKEGYLVYLIDKTIGTTNLGRKVALNMGYNNCSINGTIEIYNIVDTVVTAHTLKTYGWDDSDLFNIVTTFRYYHNKMRNIMKDKDVVNKFVGVLSRLDFNQFEKSLNNLEDKGTNVYTLKIKEKVEEFLTKLNQTQYAIRETKN